MSNCKEWTDDQSAPAVAVIYPDPGALTASLDLPGRLEAYYRAPIFARVNGYVKSWNADIGARVKAGDVIAEIDAPDLDQQLLQARADLTNQQASAKLSEVTLARRKTLIASNFVSMQEIDERTADLSNKNAAVNSSQANVERLEALAGYKKITVPFDGIVTARNTDVGALINAGGGSGPPMFIISDIKKLRVYVNVPQNYVPSVKIGAKAKIAVPEYPTRTFEATVEASARAVDVNSGTTQMQLGLDNYRGRIDAWRLCQCEAGASARGRAAAHSLQRADLRPEGPARGDGDVRQQDPVQAGDDCARPRSRDRTCRWCNGGRPRHQHAARRHHRRRSGSRRLHQGPAGGSFRKAGRKGLGVADVPRTLRSA